MLAERTRDAPIFGKRTRTLLLYLLVLVLTTLAIVFSAGTVSQIAALQHWTRIEGRIEEATVADPRTGERRSVCIAFDHAGATYRIYPKPGGCFGLSDPVPIVLPPQDPSQGRLATFYGIVDMLFFFTVAFVVLASIALAHVFGPLIFRALHPSLAQPR
ncbi:MAG: hypothetical protein ACOY82_14915 [Pseudomonadota bacterium]